MTVGLNGTRYYGHSEEHPAIVTMMTEQDLPGVTRSTMRVETVRRSLCRECGSDTCSDGCYEIGSRDHRY
jgi:hypothetical protein